MSWLPRIKCLPRKGAALQHAHEGTWLPEKGSQELLQPLAVGREEAGAGGGQAAELMAGREP